ncbi:unnamed protein product [Anisakis simplex]|uniref:Aminotran_1_2 domain-containing protein n=1 Tax=Anisakis simplex TaxID=6269 RepID=A0A0M3K9A7_ANISI|nr:unnamed protein product [Anisakis simplex]
MIMASLENALATTGGFCAGRSFVVGHQRLSGLGYCFSASLPPLLATAASEGLRVLGKEPDRFERLHRNARFMHNTLKKVFESSRFVINGDELSPVQHIYYDNEEGHGTELESDEKLEDSEKKVAREVAGKKLDELVDKGSSHGKFSKIPETLSKFNEFDEL